MRHVKKQYDHYLNIDTVIDLNRSETYKVYVVYYINGIVNSNYLDWLINQIIYLVNYQAKIYIVATILRSHEDFFRKSVSDLFPNLNIEVECHYDNEFEYRGILKVWELGQVHKNQNDIILYFHSKGLTHHKDYANNKNDNYNVILKDINKIKEIFTIFPLIDKIGYCSGGIGWIWYNFWFARGSYINTLEKPINTLRRHYYEDWLARKVDPGKQFCASERHLFFEYKNTLNTCYGFHTDGNTIANIGSFYDPDKNCYNPINI
jgi:hypothetical protein